MSPSLSPLANPVTLDVGGQKITWGDCSNWVLFAGPDIIEDDGLVLETAQEISRITKRLGIPWILKCSYDKANRQSVGSFRGPGVDSALTSLARIKAKVGCGLLTDVHETIQIPQVAEVADVIQIPAFLSRQTDLVIATAKTGKVMHIKKGQFLAPWDMKSIVKKAVSAGNDRVLLCERGTTFGYNRLINDMTGLVEMRNLGHPVVMDATHSTQLPGATGESSGGRGDMVPALARAAMAVGVDGLFMEVHPDPTKALCDGPTSLKLGNLEPLLNQLTAIWKTHFSEY
ncbi:MAG: 3-deoxy-8-phosphooctulonate synthase [Bdellovibrionales bacterium]|nr:3-deoxy-8-phosphooctulonate synthase [Bdellovibrionales bacterium]